MLFAKFSVLAASLLFAFLGLQSLPMTAADCCCPQGCCCDAGCCCEGDCDCDQCDCDCCGDCAAADACEMVKDECGVKPCGA